MQARYLVRDLLNACVIAKRDGSAYLYSLPTVLDSWRKVVCAYVYVCVYACVTDYLRYHSRYITHVTEVR